MSKTKVWCCTKNNFVLKHKHCCKKNCFTSNKKKVNVSRKSVSCRQKQDDAAQKNYCVLKQVINFFPERRTILSLMWKPEKTY